MLDDPVLARTPAVPGAPEEIVGKILEQVRAAGAPDNSACAVVDLS